MKSLEERNELGFLLRFFVRGSFGFAFVFYYGFLVYLPLVAAEDRPILGCASSLAAVVAVKNTSSEQALVKVSLLAGEARFYQELNDYLSALRTVPKEIALRLLPFLERSDWIQTNAMKALENDMANAGYTKWSSAETKEPLHIPAIYRLLQLSEPVDEELFRAFSKTLNLAFSRSEIIQKERKARYQVELGSFLFHRLNSRSVLPAVDQLLIHLSGEISGRLRLELIDRFLDETEEISEEDLELILRAIPRGESWGSVGAWSDFISRLNGRVNSEWRHPDFWVPADIPLVERCLAKSRGLSEKYRLEVRNLVRLIVQSSILSLGTTTTLVPEFVSAILNYFELHIERLENMSDSLAPILSADSPTRALKYIRAQWATGNSHRVSMISVLFDRFPGSDFPRGLVEKLSNDEFSLVIRHVVTGVREGRWPISIVGSFRPITSGQSDLVYEEMQRSISSGQSIAAVSMNFKIAREFNLDIDRLAARGLASHLSRPGDFLKGIQSVGSVGSLPAFERALRYYVGWQLIDGVEAESFPKDKARELRSVRSADIFTSAQRLQLVDRILFGGPPPERKQKSETSIEIELPAERGGWRELELIEPTDSIETWFSGLDYPFRYILWRRARNLVPGRSSVRWMDVPADLKAILIEKRSRYKTTDFSEDRSVPGMRCPKCVRLKWIGAQQVSFLGRLYDPGVVHEVDVSSILTDKVEYMDPISQTCFLGVEIHFRSDKLNSVQLRREVRTLLAGMGIKYWSEHIHRTKPSVSFFPDEFCREESFSRGVLSIAENIERLRRINLLLEIGVLKRGGRLETKDLFYGFRREAWATSGPYSSDDFKESIGQMLEIASRGTVKGMESSHPMAAIAFRTEYDADVVGTETRWVPEADARLALTEGVWTNDRLTELGESLLSWKEELPQETSFATAVARLIPNQSLDRLLEDINSELKDLITSHLKRRIRSAEKTNAELKYLLYDWTRDPIFMRAGVNEKSRILQAQREAIRAVNEAWVLTQDTISKIINQFLISTKLEEELDASLEKYKP